MLISVWRMFRSRLARGRERGPVLQILGQTSPEEQSAQEAQGETRRENLTSSRAALLSPPLHADAPVTVLSTLPKTLCSLPLK
ncbi:hypothetical protein SKAU_G00028480 [Synaphobranchus kaupii]|uniref:Uncharacterized protein n=1 Tax=Synaphobranchus kaupii TaxID=118154 RepID=A0A9Q1GDA5_SYNKA|nr:hypothetical protein SKAU_G00028480 [Synaphobranchus kaupii]